jgi:LmbE family N-acetylglucosaminyl deacetylase
LLWEADEPNHVEEVSDFVQAKITALMAHESQFESTMGIDDGTSSEIDAFADRVKVQLTEHGALAGLSWGESFHIVTDL